jgi:hypothetical protein
MPESLEHRARDCLHVKDYCQEIQQEVGLGVKVRLNQHTRQATVYPHENVLRATCSALMLPSQPLRPLSCSAYDPQKRAGTRKKIQGKKKCLSVFYGVHARRVDSSTLDFSLSSHRYPYIVFVFSARFNDS